MDSDRWLVDFWMALEGSTVEAVREIARLGKDAAWKMTLVEKTGFETVQASLQSRRNIKSQQVANAVCPVSKHRYEVMGGALDELLDWWLPRKAVELENIIIDAPPDVSFVLWLDPESLKVVGGFESRKGTLLNLERGKEFFGADWHPIAALGSN